MMVGVIILNDTFLDSAAGVLSDWIKIYLTDIYYNHVAGTEEDSQDEWMKDFLK